MKSDIQFVSLQAVAKLLGRSKSTVARYALRPDFPAALYFGGHRVWIASEIMTWATGCRTPRGA